MNQDFKKILIDIKYVYGLTQADIAKEIGVQRSYLSNIVSGIAPVTNSVLAKLSERFPKAFSVEIGKEDIKNIHDSSMETDKEDRDVIERMQNQIDSLIRQNDKLLCIIENLSKK